MCVLDTDTEGRLRYHSRSGPVRLPARDPGWPMARGTFELATRSNCSLQDFRRDHRTTCEVRLHCRKCSWERERYGGRLE